MDRHEAREESARRWQLNMGKMAPDSYMVLFDDEAVVAKARRGL